MSVLQGRRRQISAVSFESIIFIPARRIDRGILNVGAELAAVAVVQLVVLETPSFRRRAAVVRSGRRRLAIEILAGTRSRATSAARVRRKPLLTLLLF